MISASDPFLKAMTDKKTYPLRTLSEVRRRTVDDAKRSLAAAIVHTREQEEKLRHWEAALDECQTEIAESARRMTRPLGARSAAALMSHEAHLDRLREKARRLTAKRAAALDEVNRARQDEQAAREQLSKAHQQQEVIAKHEEKWNASQAARVRKMEQDATDEVASNVHQHRRLASEPEANHRPGKNKHR